MTREIRKAAVLGSGTMGSGIAALLASVGVEVALLDIPEKGTTPADPPEGRSAPALAGLERARATKAPAPLTDEEIARIRIGNFDDHLGWLADVDWVVEVVVERLDIKRALLERVVAAANPDAILSTNTSGIPIAAISEGFPPEVGRRLLGTHFFNPPRVLKLLEIIPGAGTDPEILGFLSDYATNVLGKGVVPCKDTPNFIGNRFLTLIGAQAVAYALDHGFTVEEVDAITGPLIGRPRTGTFRLYDLIGIDVMADIGRNLYPVIPNDPARDLLHHPAAQALFERMVAENRLGNKSGRGFYEVRKNAAGEKEFWTLDLNTFEYVPPAAPVFPSVTRHGGVPVVGERIRLLLSEGDRAAQFLWHHHAFYLSYASLRVPEITDSLSAIDDAQKWGFNHALGPFEIWDALGVADTVPKFEAAGYPVASWVKEMIASGQLTFYRRDATGAVAGVWRV
ncbi:MAG TPA: 3-hydroxyacyl-CoA dehydrogenase family protein [Candidatus Limnocylindrales bacterium]|nr:3-hydroxyacyl-CoA dehydrogenase family protein [Candidatus Limnocylindrales bacterium]